jgi:hypothetical protein
MVKAYNSFVVRCWVLRDQPLGDRRILDVEHVQSGKHLRTASFAEACAWMEGAAEVEAPEGASDVGPPRLAARNSGRLGD